MAIAKLNPGYENLRGAIGNLVVKHYGTKVVLTRKPVFKDRMFTEAQKTCQERFREAVLFANKLMSDPRARALYEEEARSRGKPIRSLVIGDFLHSRPALDLARAAQRPAGTFRSRDLSRQLKSAGCFAILTPNRGTMKDQNSLHVNDVWEVGGAYEYFMGRWSRLVAAGFLQWLSVPSGGSWLDVGCGTGVLSKTILEMSNPVKVRGIDQAAGFISHAQHHIRDSRAGFEVGTAESLNFASHTFDAAVSGLALNFVPQVHRAVSEMKRVTRPGGTVAAYVWDYAGGMQFLRHFWDAARTLHSNAASLDEGTRFPICSPVKLRELFMSQDIHHVELRSIDVRTHFVDFEDYWSPFLSGQGPAPAYVASLTKEQQTALREGLRSELPASPDGTIDLIARAWAVRGCA